MVGPGTCVTSSTPTVFCAVIAVIAHIPCTPQRANAFRSASIPAPPPESDPAIVSAVTVRPRVLMRGVATACSPRPSPLGLLLALRARFVLARGEDRVAAD